MTPPPGVHPATQPPLQMPPPSSPANREAGPRRIELLGLNRERLQELLSGLGEKPYRAAQLMKWVYHREVRDFARMTDLSKRLRDQLGSLVEVAVPTLVREDVSLDGTRKWLLAVDAANRIETVFIPEARRGTLCVSSQVGCALNCTFCATAQQGFNRNLSAAEIVSQLYFARQRLGGIDGAPAITNVVLMGMGEPLLNFDNVVSALEIMLDDCGFGLARKRVTLSTAGVVPGIRRLRERCPVSLAVSLHAPDDELRSALVPLNRSYPIAELLAACRDYIAGQPRQKITFEYVMLDGINDQPEHARGLIRRLASVPAKINLIPFNHFAGAGFRRSPPDSIERFRDILLGGGLMTITRKTRGDDIDAACGQLAGRVVPRSQRLRARRGMAVGPVALSTNP